ncbi:MAG: hypothetical protein WCQ81_06330, partial [Bacteroidales bacterium]
MITIYTKVSAIRVTIYEYSDSEVVQQVSDEEYATIKFELATWIKFQKGDYITVFGNKYTLPKRPAPVDKNGSNKFSYTLKFQSARADLGNVNFQLFDNTTLLTIDAYVSDTIYCKDAVVSYSSKIWRYKYITAKSGQTPAENDYWTEVFQYSSSTAYTVGMFVYSGNVVYRCLTAGTGLALEEGINWTVVNTAPMFDFQSVLAPTQFAQLICNNMNRARPTQTWVVGSCIQSTPKEQAFSNVKCLDAAGSIAELFETEFWVDMNGNNFQLNINRRAYTAVTMVELSQGEGGGLTNISCQEISDARKVTRLVALGGTRNLNGTYRNGSPRLMLPDRYFIDSSLIDADDPQEDTQTWDDIYPCMVHAEDDYNATTAYQVGAQVLSDSKSWDCVTAGTGHTPGEDSYWVLSEGQITTVVTTTITSATTSFKFIDEHLTFNPLSSAYAMADGTQPKVKFITGNLAGYEFPISDYDATTKQITITQIQDSTDSNLPTVGYSFSQDDRFVFVDLYMPQSYVDKAELRLKAKALEYL